MQLTLFEDLYSAIVLNDSILREYFSCVFSWRNSVHVFIASKLNTLSTEGTAMTDISSLSFSERSVLFAKISQLAYYTDKATRKQAKRLGFSVREFYNCSSAQAYLLETDTDIVIACRGTEPHQFADLKADANAWPVVSETISRVHAGFKGYV